MVQQKWNNAKVTIKLPESLYPPKKTGVLFAAKNKNKMLSTNLSQSQIIYIYMFISGLLVNHCVYLVGFKSLLLQLQVNTESCPIN